VYPARRLNRNPRLGVLALLAALGWLAGCATPSPILSRSGGASREGALDTIRACVSAEESRALTSREKLERVGIVAAGVVFTAALGTTAGAAYSSSQWRPVR
jgi:hypothetical protein